VCLVLLSCRLPAVFAFALLALEGGGRNLHCIPSEALPGILYERAFVLVFHVPVMTWRSLLQYAAHLQAVRAWCATGSGDHATIFPLSLPKHSQRHGAFLPACPCRGCRCLCPPGITTCISRVSRGCWKMAMPSLGLRAGDGRSRRPSMQLKAGLSELSPLPTNAMGDLRITVLSVSGGWRRRADSRMLLRSLP